MPVSKLQLFNPVARPRDDSYNRFGANVELYKSFNIGLNFGHSGIDITAQTKEKPWLDQQRFPIYAAHDGIVMTIEQDSKGGIGITIRTEDARLDVNGNPQFWKSLYW